VEGTIDALATGCRDADPRRDVAIAAEARMDHVQVIAPQGSAGAADRRQRLGCGGNDAAPWPFPYGHFADP